MTGHGPYATREQAIDAAAALYAAIDAADPGGPMTDEIRARRRAAIQTYFDNVLHACGVEIGAYETDLIDWLTGYDPEIIQVFLGWITRAHDAGRNQLAAEMAELHARVDALATAARRAAPVAADLDGFRQQITNGETP